MSTPEVQVRTCFVSAPAGMRLDTLRDSLRAHGFRMLVPQELSAGTDWASEIKKQLSLADLVIGVLTSDRQSPWVLFELGQASALGRRILLLTAPDSELVPFALHQFLVLRTSLDNREAIDFALEQVLSAPRPSEKREPPRRRELAGLGSRADVFLSRLERSLASNDARSLEGIVADALKQSGADLVVASPEHDVGADLAVWSDVLEPFVGNPLLIELKLRLRGQGDVRNVLNKLALQLTASGTRWALLLYGEGPTSQDQAQITTPPNVLVLSLRSLLEALRTRAFPEVVRDLRNQRVHGVES